MVFVVILMFNYGFSVGWSLNIEGLGLLKFRDRIEKDPFGALSSWNDDGEGSDLGHCSWFGVECSDGKAVALNLRDLCLEGTLAPDLGKANTCKIYYFT